MRIVDIIDKKKQGKELSKEEINYFISSLTDKSMPDYQASAWLMAVWFQGMSEEETANLTEAIINSGETIHFGALSKKIVDKHSTGGVGDKVTITLIPLLAAAGIPIAKLSGKGLGHTGGTIDKLESIPGFSTTLTLDDMHKQVEEIGVAIGQQTQNLTPADGMLYALRDVTATIDSMPLIASSVVSKKIASGADNIILDVKYGSGAFMKTAEDAVQLSKRIVKIGRYLDKSITAVVTSMEEPLGRAVGHALEVIEAIEFLKGNITSGDLAELTYSFASIILMQLRYYDNEAEVRNYLKSLIESGKAIEKFKELISVQGGDVEIIDNYDKFNLPTFKIECESKKGGYVQNINACEIANALGVLGGSRESATGRIDHSVGVYLNKKSGEYVNKGETLYTIYSNDEESTRIAQRLCDGAFSINDSKPAQNGLIYEIVKTDEDDDV